jgi:ADP-heptose:LPS heptosyltransferase
MKTQTILISPWSRPRTDGKANAKNYPYWDELVDLLVVDYDVIQIVHGDERQVRDVRCERNRTLPEIERLVKECDAFICVDNFLQHLGHYVGRRGFVLYGVSDPSLFGYPENVNIYAGRNHFRQHQFQTWNEVEFNEDAFVKPGRVYEIIKSSMPINNAAAQAGETIMEAGADFIK